MQAKPNRPRSEIMLQKRAVDRDFKYKNRELAERGKAQSRFELILILVGTLFVMVFTSGLIDLLCQYGRPVPDYLRPSLDGSIVVEALFFLMFAGSVLFMLWHRQKRQRLYTEASELVLHKEPVRAHVQFFSQSRGDSISEYLRLVPVGEDKALYSRLGNLQILKKHPELRDGAEVEVYFRPEGGAIGMFVNDRVEWFI